MREVTVRATQAAVDSQATQASMVEGLQAAADSQAMQATQATQASMVEGPQAAVDSQATQASMVEGLQAAADSQAMQATQATQAIHRIIHRTMVVQWLCISSALSSISPLDAQKNAQLLANATAARARRASRAWTRDDAGLPARAATSVTTSSAARRSEQAAGKHSLVLRPSKLITSMQQGHAGALARVCVRGLLEVGGAGDALSRCAVRSPAAPCALPLRRGTRHAGWRRGVNVREVKHHQKRKLILLRMILFDFESIKRGINRHFE